MTVSKDIIDAWIYPKICPICSNKFSTKRLSFITENIRCKDYTVNYFSNVIDIFNNVYFRYTKC
jgi:hypothetical protein